MNVQNAKTRVEQMITDSQRPSATIIAFPDNARRRATRFQEEARAIIESRYDNVADYEGGWYHSDAIKEAERGTKQ